jgi:hypothetical protein
MDQWRLSRSKSIRKYKPENTNQKIQTRKYKPENTNQKIQTRKYKPGNTNNRKYKQQEI